MFALRGVGKTHSSRLYDNFGSKFRYLPSSGYLGVLDTRDAASAFLVLLSDFQLPSFVRLFKYLVLLKCIGGTYRLSILFLLDDLRRWAQQNCKWYQT